MFYSMRRFYQVKTPFNRTLVLTGHDQKYSFGLICFIP
jgi:hypothetical protein